MTKFDQETGLRPAGARRYEGVISPDWSIVRGANGGHIAAILLSAMALEVNDPGREPRSLTVHFARVPRNEPFIVETSVERHGRTMSNVSARMIQDDKLIALAIGVLATPRSGTDFIDIAMPEVPHPDAIAQVEDRSDFPFGRQFDFKRVIGPAPGEVGDKAEIGVWLRLREPQIVDHVVAAQLLDAFAPAVFSKLGVGGGGGGVPTIEMTFHFRQSLPLPAAAAGDWCLGVWRTTLSKGGFVEEDGWLWTPDGTLLAQSRQLALVSGP